VTSTAREKKALRAHALACRAEAAHRHGPSAGEQLAAHGLGFLDLGRAAAVSGFWAIGEELSPAALLIRLISEGHTAALPVMQGKDRPLLFRAWAPGDEMAPIQWGISEPLATRPLVEPDVLLVPLLAFDGAGYRLGYGGGFYDRTLERLRRMKPVTAVGIAYDEQRLDAVPHLNYDQPLDWVLTPFGPIKCRPQRI